MVRFYEAKTPFDFFWEQEAQEYWQRYPNPKSTHVLLEDMTYRQIRNGKLYTKRLLTKNHEVPKWRKLWKNPSLIRRIKAGNLYEKSGEAVYYEKVVYRSCDENTDETIATRRAKIEFYVYGFAKAKQLNT